MSLWRRLQQRLCSHRYRLRTRPNAENYGFALWNICEKCGHIGDPFMTLPSVEIGETIQKHLGEK